MEDHLFYECGPQKPLKDLTSSPLLVFMSGLDQSSTHDFTMSIELFQQWLYGNLPNIDKDFDFEASNVVRVIIAGNSVRTSMEVRPKTILMRQPESIVTLQAVKAVDDLLFGWSQSVNVDLMPGEFDPANCMLPQQPMHHCMFPNSISCGALRCVTNPYEFYIEDRLILGTSGQNLTNIQKYSHIEDTLDALESIAKWSILAPTAPDTLPCYPFYDEDPFIIKQCPHILFAGNTSKFQTSVFEGIRINYLILLILSELQQQNYISTSQVLVDKRFASFVFHHFPRLKALPLLTFEHSNASNFVSKSKNLKILKCSR